MEPPHKEQKGLPEITGSDNRLWAPFQRRPNVRRVCCDMERAGVFSLRNTGYNHKKIRRLRPDPCYFTVYVSLVYTFFMHCV
jgi:hypothetical protein